jgi:hypothetical protein
MLAPIFFLDVVGSERVLPDEARTPNQKGVVCRKKPFCSPFFRP